MKRLAILMTLFFGSFVLLQGQTELDDAYYWYGAYPYYDLHITRPYDLNVVRDDNRIKDGVSSKLWWSPYVERDQIKISVDDGVVTLEGTVDSYWEYTEAVEKAWEGGAYSVENELTIK